MSGEDLCTVHGRRASMGQSALNGIEYVEVVDGDAPAGSPRQRTLIVRCYRPVAALTAAPYPIRLRVDGGARSAKVGVTWVGPAAELDRLVERGLLSTAEAQFFRALPARGNLLLARTDAAGDHSTYTLRLTTTSDLPHRFDPRLSSMEFTFKAECASDVDCLPVFTCVAPPLPARAVDYLAKDYGSFRRLMLDRMTELLPRWTERNPADVGVALVELLAHVGDHLSYQQDAMATEAYLGTARHRVSVRRHARLVDYLMHDGCNARVWLQVLIDPTSGANPPASLPANTMVSTSRAAGAGVVFHTLHALDRIRAQHQRMPLYTWGDRECCLPAGATRATLSGRFDALRSGDVLVFEEQRGPRTGRAEDADPTRRHAVRLVSAPVITADQVANAPPTTVTEIEWGLDDALPFPLCVSARSPTGYHDDISVALGNIVLADHGEWVTDEPLAPGPATAAPRRFRPRLAERPLTHAASFDPAASASAALRWDMAEVLPVLELVDQDARPWRPQRDLLSSGPLQRELVVETEDDGRARLRFGDDRNGARPPAGTTFRARYRVGNGSAGNVGVESLAHIVPAVAGITGVRNPMAARGGLDPESAAEVRRRAPHAFRTQERAVTEADYARIVERDPDVQRAAASFRWTGSWHTVFVAVDPLARVADPPALRERVVAGLERHRMAGYDLEVDEPRYVPLAIEMHVCVKPEYFRHQVQRALLEVFTSGHQPDGRPGLFHPDAFTFGQTLYPSQLYGAAQAIAGVASVTIDRFQRQRDPVDGAALAADTLVLGELEIACVDNDPSFPDRGVFTLHVDGGR